MPRLPISEARARFESGNIPKHTDAELTEAAEVLRDRSPDWIEQERARNWLTRSQDKGGEGMTEAKWTPGPWYAERTRLDGHEWFVESECRNLPPYNWLPRFKAMLDPMVPLGDAKSVDADSGTASTDRGCCPTAVAENEANARLIAAAPDLHEALYRLTREADLDGLRQKAGWDAWLSMADAALAKAEGRQ